MTQTCNHTWHRLRDLGRVRTGTALGLEGLLNPFLPIASPSPQQSRRDAHTPAEEEHTPEGAAALQAPEREDQQL